MQVQANLVLFCDRFDPTPDVQPASPNVTYVTLTGTAPQWAVAEDMQAQDPRVYFELEIVFADPVIDLKASNLFIEAGGISETCIP